jgi:hypothetical protein
MLLWYPAVGLLRAAIALSERLEDERLPINSWVHENTGKLISQWFTSRSADCLMLLRYSLVDLLYSRQMMSLPQGQEDEYVPLNSEVPETTG